MFFLTGVARYLFVPLAEAVVFAMLASYLLSRTLVPTMAMYLLQRAQPHGRRAAAEPAGARCSARFERGFERLRDGYRGLLDAARRAAGALFVPVFLAVCLSRFAAAARGSARTSSRPSTAASSSCTCARRPAPASRRRRGSADQVEAAIRREIPARRARRASSTTSACRTAASTCSYSALGVIGAADADILVSLKAEAPADRRLHPTTCGARCRSEFPGVTFFFLPADIVSRS